VFYPLLKGQMLFEVKVLKETWFLKGVSQAQKCLFRGVCWIGDDAHGDLRRIWGISETSKTISSKMLVMVSGELAWP
jgi:hypothetical protein